LIAILAGKLYGEFMSRPYLDNFFMLAIIGMKKPEVWSLPVFRNNTILF